MLIIYLYANYFSNSSVHAGKGAVYTNAGDHELEASIMNGSNLECGGVSLIKTIKNPISAARLVMEKSIHNLLAGKEVEKLCIKYNNNIELCENSYYDTEHRKKQLIKAQEVGKVILDHDSKSNIENKMGTVGCVVMYKGNISAATSTGGMTNKSSGRMGDSALIGI
jgi:beta-aspartyl-peptidase (threonine type)